MKWSSGERYEGEWKMTTVMAMVVCTMSMELFTRVNLRFENGAIKQKRLDITALDQSTTTDSDTIFEGECQFLLDWYRTTYLTLT